MNHKRVQPSPLKRSKVIDLTIDTFNQNEKKTNEKESQLAVENNIFVFSYKLNESDIEINDEIKIDDFNLVDNSNEQEDMGDTIFEFE